PALVLSERILWDLQAYLDRAARRGAFLHVAERAQQVAHGLVGLQHETREARDALLPRPRGEATQQQRPQSAPLPVIGHRHGGLPSLSSTWLTPTGRSHTPSPATLRPRTPAAAGFAPRPRSVANARRPAPRARRRGTTAVTLRSCPAGGPSSRTNAGARPATR